ncbi:unnamed protein product, partial [marine sediment metagenome]
MGLVERIIKRFFPNGLSDEEMAGIMLDWRACWEVSKIKSKSSPAFFKAIGNLLPAGCTLCIEGTNICDEVKAFLEGHSVDEICKVQLGTYWPRPEVYHAVASDEVFSALAELSERRAIPEICDHIYVYKNKEVLLSWNDAFSIPLYVSKRVAESSLKAFCQTLG